MAGLYVNASCGIGSLPPCNDTGIRIDGYMAGVARHIKNFHSHSTFYEQAASGTLLAFSWLSPSWQSCDHPCNDMAKGERQLKDAYEALCAGPVGPPAALPSCAKQNSPALSWLASEFCLRRLRRSTLGCWRRLSACEQSTRRALCCPQRRPHVSSCLVLVSPRVSSCAGRTGTRRCSSSCMTTSAATSTPCPPWALFKETSLRYSRGRRPPIIRFPDRHFAGFPRVCALSIRTSVRIARYKDEAAESQVATHFTPLQRVRCGRVPFCT